MSGNTSIKEGGQARSFGPVNALMVQGADGKYYPWVPESERQLSTKSVNKNGVYQAKKDGVYGYSSFYVNVPTDQGVTGTDPTTGQQVSVGVDPTGKLTETVVPAEIRVETPPPKTEYIHGEAINYSGIVVHAYSVTGQDMGAVPFNELVFPVTTADVQQTEGWTNDAGLNALMLYYTPHVDYNEDTVYLSDRILGKDGYGYRATYGGGGPATVLVTRYKNFNYGASMTSNEAAANMYSDSVAPSPWSQTKSGWVRSGSSSSIIRPGSFSTMSFSDVLADVPESTVNPTTVDPSTLHAAQILPVLWTRPGDNVVLQTSFSISVLSAGDD